MVELSKKQKIDANRKAIQQISFTGNLDQAENTQMFFIIKEAKETTLETAKRKIKVSWFHFVLIYY